MELFHKLLCYGIINSVMEFIPILNSYTFVMVYLINCVSGALKKFSIGKRIQNGNKEKIKAHSKL